MTPAAPAGATTGGYPVPQPGVDGKANCCKDVIFALTGKFPQLDVDSTHRDQGKDQVTKILESFGGIVRGQSGKTDILVVGLEYGVGKLDTALRNGTKLMMLDDLKEALKVENGDVKAAAKKHPTELALKGVSWSKNSKQPPSWFADQDAEPDAKEEARLREVDAILMQIRDKAGEGSEIAELVDEARVKLSADLSLFQKRVLDYYIEHGTSADGCTIAAVVAGLGADESSVRAAVSSLVVEERLHSPLEDDDHYKAVVDD